METQEAREIRIIKEMMKQEIPLWKGVIVNQPRKDEDN